ncbi:MutS-related protein [Deminuibacter soli]|uniref:DNA mismatch repair protein MutS n=1 Tax=Deminuibacter soli TaxID=2291815 RepID=A0A3E1NFK2_9BACT|nr:DNA mismatch repair protein MutS [Deminuibacter soli]RFM26584.1 DNA mismatch repair protein MutS [Deminuibacter soli]
MQADKTTLYDLSIMSHDEELSVIHHFDFTRTIGGREWLRVLLGKPLSTLKDITDTQALLRQVIAIEPHWPQKISNGTIMVIGRFYETAVNDIPASSNLLTALIYKITNPSDFGIVRYSVTHFIDFVQGLQELSRLLTPGNQSTQLKDIATRIDQVLQRPQIQEMLQVDRSQPLPVDRMLRFGNYLRYHFKQQVVELIEMYSKLDAYYSMAVACKQFNFIFPEFIEAVKPAVTATQLFHPLLQTPVSYDIALTEHENFLFLTGANMAGKSTFIKAVGIAVYLAHVGMGVPAQHMQLTMFDGLLSNIQVADNIVKGESYFFNEVQRIRKTIEKISDGKKWLILIDELFKGTNVQDAMKCSTVVIEGLRKMQNTLFILSTHLYEIGDQLQVHSNIQFRYFETQVNNDQLEFNYQLKHGISNDRLGYLILKNEGVVNMLEQL